MTTPPYTGRDHPQHTNANRPPTHDNACNTSTTTPIVSHRDDGFTISDLQYLSQEFQIENIEHAEDTAQTRVWIDKRPGTDSSRYTLNELKNRHMAIHRGTFIHAAYHLPDGTKRVIWEHRVFDDNTPTSLNPKSALVEAEAADWEPITDIHQHRNQHQSHD